MCTAWHGAGSVRGAGPEVLGAGGTEELQLPASLPDDDREFLAAAGDGDASLALSKVSFHPRVVAGADGIEAFGQKGSEPGIGRITQFVYANVPAGQSAGKQDDPGDDHGREPPDGAPGVGVGPHDQEPGDDRGRAQEDCQDAVDDQGAECRLDLGDEHFSAPDGASGGESSCLIVCGGQAAGACRLRKFDDRTPKAPVSTHGWGKRRRP
jgi:hypothetical protein